MSALNAQMEGTLPHDRPHEDPQARRSMMIRVSAILMTLSYLGLSAWGLWELMGARYDHALWLSSGALTFSTLLSLLSAKRHYQKLRWVRGVERQMRAEQSQEAARARRLSWVEGFGDRGVGLINLVALALHLPLLLAMNRYYDLELFGYDQLSLFTPSASHGAEELISLGEWGYFVLSQNLPINPLLELLQGPLPHEGLASWVARDQALSAQLTPLGELSIALIGLGLLSLLLESVYRRKTMREMLSERVSTVSLSAMSLKELEERYQGLFDLSADEELSLREREALNQERQRALDAFEDKTLELTAKRRHLNTLLEVFPKPFLYQQFSAEVLDPSGALEARAALLEACLESPARRRLRSWRHPFAQLAYQIIQSEPSAALRRVALLGAEGWVSARQRATVMRRAREAAQQSSAFAGSVNAHIHYERLALAATFALVSQGDLRSLSALIAGLRSPSPLLRRESIQLLERLKLSLAARSEHPHELHQFMSHLIELVQLFAQPGSSRGQGERVKELLSTLHKQLVDARDEERLELELLELLPLLTELLSSEVGVELNRPSLIERSFKLWALDEPQEIARSLWGILIERPLEPALRRELFEGVSQRPQLMEAFIRVTRQALRTGPFYTRQRSAQLLGEAPYHVALHRALIDELTLRMRPELLSELSAPLLSELTCSLGRLCAVERPNQALVEESAALLDTAPQWAELSEQSKARFEVARRYALSTLTPSDLFVTLFEWGTGLEGLFSAQQLSESAHDRLSAEQVERLRGPASQLICADQAQLSAELSRAALALNAARIDEPFRLSERERVSIAKRLRRGEELPLEGDRLGVAWVNHLAGQVKAQPSATGLLLTLSLLDHAFGAELQRAALRKLKQYSSFLKRSMLGPLSHRSLSEWVTMRLITLLERCEPTAPIWRSLVLQLGAYPCERSAAKLTSLIQDHSLQASAHRNVAKAIGQQSDPAQIEPLVSLYHASSSVTVKGSIIEALTLMSLREADEALISLVEAALHGPHLELNHEASRRVIQRLLELEQLELLSPLYQAIDRQQARLQRELFKAYRLAPLGDLELTQALWSTGLKLIKSESSAIELVREVARSLVPLHKRLSSQLKALAPEREHGPALEELAQLSFVALKLCVSGRALTPHVLGILASAMGELQPQQMGAWVEMKLKSASIQERSQLIASLESAEPERFVSLAEQHLEAQRHNLKPGGLSVGCINRLSRPFLRQAGRRGISLVKQLVLASSDSYSPYLVYALKDYGDPHADRPWLEEFVEHLQSERRERGLIYPKLEPAILDCLHAYNDVSALAKLIELALMDTNSEQEYKLQREAIKTLEGLGDLEREIFIKRAQS